MFILLFYIFNGSFQHIFAHLFLKIYQNIMNLALHYLCELKANKSANSHAPKQTFPENRSQTYIRNVLQKPTAGPQSHMKKDRLVVPLIQLFLLTSLVMCQKQ